ncbi:TPA: twin-arginine translocase subunit TatB [Acinetobacter baumannii]|uniref:Sec-independent protein translocase protein TatB n=1 Tax=Acinetobacter baumannii TaxID=470 RepID=UPI001020B052|nr:Sec-independent protein translocase protein TatB [Acinetobacter baumannii]MDM8385915.1 Sec-independent protein translocase protein TatB [Acinetobacter baumannii]HCJ0465421.1 twin-arginine translocase subunit TatB [Acinetobacter baumannii]HCJ0587811.1 twin-arginine translocase subunit TatB [Acinetobacter baumannii]HCJ0599272.1 twin-arginine translocase subunit TatB [Acinetobacter baumannii]HCJ4943579.1 twin-arginine translocase subunit TatB [Acinetobacter baumannii]
MFNISFGELLAFAIIALIILGPEKLPHTLRSVFLKYRAVKNQISKIQNDIENELDLIELKRVMQEELQKIKQNEEQLKQQLALMQQEIENVQTSVFTEQKTKARRINDYIYTRSQDELKTPFLAHFKTANKFSEDQAA